MDGTENTRIQYIMVDSDLVEPRDPLNPPANPSSSFTLDLNQESNLHCEGINQVIGIKLVDFYVTQIGSSGQGGNLGAKYIDLVCKDVPKVAQILDERNGQTFARIPLERNFEGSSMFRQHDKQWFPFNRKTVLFNPINIQKLNFDIYEMRGNGDYELLQADAKWYMILEIITRVEREESKPEEQDEEDGGKENYEIEESTENVDDVNKWDAMIYIFLIIMVGFLLILPKRRD